MIKNKKLLLSLGLSIATVLPLAAIVSCGHSKSNISKSKSGSGKSKSGSKTNSNDSDSSSDFKINSKTNSKNTDLQKVTKIIKENLINKNVARWTKPSSASINGDYIKNSLLNQELLFSSSFIEGYKLNDIKLSNANDDKGTANINYVLTRGENKEKHVVNYLMSGFLTTEQERKNDNLKEFLNELQMNKNNYSISLFTKNDLNSNNVNIEESKNKTLEELLKKDIDNLSSNKIVDYLNNKTLKIINLKPVIRNVFGFEIPYLEFEAYMENKGIKSSIFSIIINGFEKKLNEDDIKKIIDLGFLLKKNQTFLTLPSKINESNYATYFNEYLSESSLLLRKFSNRKNIQFKIKNVREQNDSNGSLKVDIDVKSTDNSISEFTHTTTLYGFRIKNPNVINVLIDSKSSSENYEIIVVGHDLPDDISDYVLKCENKDIKINSIEKKSTSTSVKFVISKSNKLEGKSLKLKIKNIEKEMTVNIPNN